jgi:hypothetical protein
VKLGLWVLLALSLAVSPARADDESPEKAQARTLLGQGNALFERGDLRGALVNFRAAYALYPSPKLLVNAAAAERELGDLAGAANDLRHFLDEVSESQEDPFLIDRARQDLRALERRVGRFTISGWPARSTLEVDGHLLRDPAYARPGEHHVKARSPSGAEVERDLAVSAGEEIAVAAPVPVAGLEERTAPAVQPRKSRWWIPVVVTTVVLAGAGLGVGLGLGLSHTAQPLAGDLGTVKLSDFH